MDYYSLGECVMQTKEIFLSSRKQIYKRMNK